MEAKDAMEAAQAPPEQKVVSSNLTERTKLTFESTSSLPAPTSNPAPKP
jgi:hypothetical protein